MNIDKDIASIIAATITAENAMRAAIITAVISLLSALLSFINSRKASQISKEIGEKNIKILEQRRFIDTISTQRIEWINKLRDEFVKFNMKSHTICMILFSSERGMNRDYNYGRDYQDLLALKNHIELLLNPNEIFSKKLILLLNKIFDILFSGNPQLQEYNRYRELVIFTQQVILKSEWRRIKIETEKGEQIDDDQMNEIFEKVAKKIDVNKYNEVLFFS